MLQILRKNFCQKAGLPKNFIQRVMQPPTHVGVILTISGSLFEVTLEILTRFLGETDLVSGFDIEDNHVAEFK